MKNEMKKGGRKPAAGSHTIKLVVSALMVALAVVLKQIPLFVMPQGGSVSPLAMLPIVLCAYFFGTWRACMAGACMGILDFLLKPYVIHPVQLLLDYPLAFGALGLAGLVFALAEKRKAAKPDSQQKDYFIPAYLVGAAGRYLFATLSGWVFFGAYAPEGFNGLTWSLWYNLGYLGGEAALTVIVLAFPQVRSLFRKLKHMLN